MRRSHYRRFNYVFGNRDTVYCKENHLVGRIFKLLDDNEAYVKFSIWESIVINVRISIKDLVKIDKTEINKHIRQYNSKRKKIR